jgi:hypothetical protein
MTTKAQDALQFIESKIAEGKTVSIGNAGKCIVITPKNFAKWQASGHKLFIIDSEGFLRIASGKKFNIICTCTTLLVSISAI